MLIELKANPLTKNIPVLIISVVDDRPKGLALGAVDYLVISHRNKEGNY